MSRPPRGRTATWENQCRGKYKHGTRAGAVKAREDMAKRRDDPDLLLALVPYECPWCNMFHLGSRKRTEFQKLLRRRDRREEKARRKTLWKEGFNA